MNKLLQFTVASLALVWISSCKEGREWPAYDSTEERLGFEERYNRETLEKLNKRMDELEKALVADPEEGKRKELEVERERLTRRLER
ncbi:MAG: hypothetical protein AAGB14_13935, partial [Verrucomicrobiota bacterium]